MLEASKDKDSKETMDNAKDNTKDNSENGSLSPKGRPGGTKPGFNQTFPKHLIKKFEITLKFAPGEVPKITVNSHMLIVSVPGEQLKEKFDFGDWITKVNDVLIESRSQYYAEIAKLNQQKEPITVKWRIRRMLRCDKIDDPANNDTLPAAVEIQPGYNYFLVCVALHPGSTLGLDIKSYNNKVIVVSTDNAFECASFRSLCIGDTILAVERVPVSTVSDASARMKKILKNKRFMLLAVERPESPIALRQMRVALYSQKSREIDPRMPNDCVEICREEIKRIKAQKSDQKFPDILNNRIDVNGRTEKSRRKDKDRRVQMSKIFTEVNIGTNPINPLILQKVPPRQS